MFYNKIMNKPYKYRIYPNNEQKVLLAKTFGCVRFVYNKTLAEKQSYYEETGKPLRITLAKYKPEYEWLREVDSLALANAQLHLEAAYKNFFRDKNVGYPKFKSKRKRHDSYTTNLVNGNIVLEAGRLKLPKSGTVKIKQHRMIPEGYRLKSVTVSKAPSGKYFASILYEYEADITAACPVNVVGLDFSMKGLYVSSDGECAEYLRFYRQSQEKFSLGGRIMSTLNAKEYKQFEGIKNVRNDGSEYWSARDLASILKYSKWENFSKVIKRAMIACQNSGRSITNDFPDARKIVNAGVTTKSVKDYELSRYACYLIVQNGDPRKEVIALGQTYFAIQTHRQEVADRFNQLDEDNKRLVVRGDIRQWNQLLAGAAYKAGVITDEEFSEFQNSGYVGLSEIKFLILWAVKN